MDGPSGKGKQNVVCHAFTTSGLVKNALLLCGTKLSDAYPDFHDDINGEVFKKQFRNSWSPNFLTDKCCHSNG